MDSSKTQTQLFRKVALERLSSPEQLDAMVQVVTRRLLAGAFGVTLDDEETP